MSAAFLLTRSGNPEPSGVRPTSRAPPVDFCFLTTTWMFLAWWSINLLLRINIAVCVELSKDNYVTARQRSLIALHGMELCIMCSTFPSYSVALTVITSRPHWQDAYRACDRCHGYPWS